MVHYRARDIWNGAKRGGGESILWQDTRDAHHGLSDRYHTIHHLLTPLRKKLLQELQREVLNNKPGDSLEIYLTIFILLHNMELTRLVVRYLLQPAGLARRLSD